MTKHIHWQLPGILTLALAAIASAQTSPPARITSAADALSLTPVYVQNSTEPVDPAAAGSNGDAQADAHEPGTQSAQNEANNPLTPKITINVHNYYIPSFYDVDGDGNQLLFRGLVPHKLFGLPQLFRFTQPVVTVPTGDETSFTGIGDLTLMDLIVIPKKPFEFGVGPMLVIPLGQEQASSEKWQLGVAGIVIAPQKWGLLGALATYQQSFAGSSARDDVSLFTLQPLAIYNLPEGYYLRSTATWNYDANAGTYYIPVGFGAGKVFNVSDKVTMNAFIEPQYTVFHDGDGLPEWQIFVGVNFQFALK